MDPDDRLFDNLREEEARRRAYGNVRPIIHAVFEGHRLVAVGSTLFVDRRWKTFTDFLFDYLKLSFGREWWDTEQKKPIAEQHPVLHWSEATYSFRRSHPPNADGICEAVPDGPTMAYVALAYDLYVLNDHHLLQNRLIQRLKNRDQFQGVRYELFVTATCVRADYEIVYEDERDRSVKHNEFIARQRLTGQTIVVEAKSRHRPGVLAMDATPAPPEDLRVGIGQLVRDALGKPATHPRAIFVDVNFPPAPPNSGAPVWLPEALSTLRDIIMEQGNVIPWNIVVLTNHPYHYGPQGVTFPAEQTAGHLPLAPRPPVAARQALTDLLVAAQQFGKVPTSFPDE